MKAVTALLIALTSASMALTRVYFVEPVKAEWSGWTGFQDTISQTITCNFDSLKYVELFAGDTCNGGSYVLSVRTVPGDFPIASGAGNAVRSHSWVAFDNITVTYPESIVKGKQYEFKFTRSGSDSIQYYYNTDNPYEYGVIGIPGMNPHPTQWDLALRVNGVMDTIGANWFGAVPSSSFFV